MKMVHDDVHVDRSDDPANSIFPRGKLAKLEGKRSPAKGKKGKNGNAARGNYGNVNGRAICPKQRRSAAPEPPRTPLQSGIHKLVQASVRFSPGKDGGLKTGFAGEALTPPELRERLRRLFTIKLTEQELSAVFAHFVPDGGMELDGNMFLIHFIQMGQAERDRRRIERLEMNRNYIEQRSLEEAELSQTLRHRVEHADGQQTRVEWGPEDQASAMAMIAEAAASYDKYSPAAVSLDAFEGANMTPPVFKEQLRRVFKIKLSPQQLAGLMAKFDKDGDGVIDCAEFLLTFFMTGFQWLLILTLNGSNSARKGQTGAEGEPADKSSPIMSNRSHEERSRRVELRREAERKRKEKEELAKKNRREEAEANARQKVDHEYTSDEQAKGMAKLIEAAVLYDATGPACLGLGAFQGDSMPPHVFKEQLRRVFNIKLTPQELGGVMHRFDKDGDGAVDVVEFTKAFFKLGFEERTRRTKERRTVAAARIAREREEEKRTQREIEQKNALQVDHSFSEEALASATEKLTHAATRYDKNHPATVSLEAFDGAQMEGHVFREQLKRVFGIKLTPSELGAAIHMFDQDGNGMVSCPEFLLMFFKIGFQAKEALRAERREYDRAMANRAAEQAAEREKEIALRAELKVSTDFNEEDRASAMAKISTAAARYDKNHPSCLGLNAFDGALMPPHVFKEQLKRVFGLKLSPAELGAVMQEFDKDGDGTVNCSEFLLIFFRAGFETRNKELQRRRKVAALAAKRASEQERRRFLESERRTREATLAPYTDKDLDDTLDMLIVAGARYDRRQLGPAGLKAWEGKSMSPAELKDTLRQTFHMKLAPAQVGALAHLFGNDDGPGNGDVFEGVFAPKVQIEVPEFLTTFFKISAVAKELASRRDAASRLKEYRVALKERLVQQEEVRRTLKAMRAHPPKRPLTVDSGLARVAGRGKLPDKRRGNSMDPGERVRFHIAAARNTSRLDLSTWADRSMGDFLLSKVPRQVWHLTFLTELWLTNNDLQALPSQIQELRMLRTLGVGRNRISRLPVELGFLPDLEQVFAEKNWISTLPKELASCRKLRELRLGGNQLSRLPDCIPELRGLEVLDLRDNSIEQLPLELKYLRALLDLDLDGNPIGPEIPQCLFTLVNLARLSLAGSRLGPAQGSQLEEKLRLDTLTINPNAVLPPKATSDHQQQQQPQHVETPNGPAARGRRINAKGLTQISTSVPAGRLSELREQIPAYTTRRLPGLDLLPSDAKAMMRAKANKTICSSPGVHKGNDNNQTARGGWAGGGKAFVRHTTAALVVPVAIKLL